MKGWKTVIVNMLAILLGGASGAGFIDPISVPADAAQQVVDVVTNANVTIGWGSVVWGVINLIFRAVTSTPIGKSK